MKKSIVTVIVVVVVVLYAAAAIGYYASQPAAIEPKTELGEIETSTNKPDSRPKPKPPHVYQDGPNQSDIIKLVNAARKSNSLAELRPDSSLEESACAKNSHMVANGYWQHIAPDGTEFHEFISDTGYLYSVAGENLAVGPPDSTSQSIFDSWMGSRTHRDNILKQDFTEIGVCVIRQADFLTYGDSYIVTQHFARPL